MDTGETGVNMNVPGVGGACGWKVHDHGQAKKSKFNLKSKHGAAIGGAVTGMGEGSKVKGKVRWPKMSPKSEHGGRVAAGLVSTSTDQPCTAWAV